MKNDKRAQAAKVFLALLARSPKWIEANRLRNRSAAFLSDRGNLSWQSLGEGGARA